MGKIISLHNNEEKKEKYEVCVICQKKTNIKRDTHIENRYGYVIGVGQLCYDCYNEYKGK